MPTDTSAARLARYAAAQALYDGTWITNRGGRRNSFGRLSAVRPLLATLIDAVVDHMGTPRLSWGDTEAGQRAEAFHDSALAANRLARLDPEADLDAAIYGEVFQKVIWDAIGSVSVRNVPASQIDVVLDRDGETPLEFRHAYLAGRDRVEERWRADHFAYFLNGALHSESANPYGRPPFVLWLNRRLPGRPYWGVGHPERLASIAETHELASRDLDNTMTVSGNIVTLTGVDDAPNAGVFPGSVWTLPEGADVDVLDVLGASAEWRLAYLSQLREEFHTLAAVPRAALGRDDNVADSGTALRIQLGPLLRQVERRRRLRAETLIERARTIWAVHNAISPAQEPWPGEPAVTWTDAIESDREADLGNAATELALGRSRAAVLRSVGVDAPEAELASRLAEDAASVKANTPPQERTL